MDKVKIVLLALLFATPALAQQPSRVSNMPQASVPFNGSEYLYMVQNSISKKVSAQQLQVQETVSPLVGILYGNGPSLPTTSIAPGTGVVTALGQPVTGAGSIVLGAAPSIANPSITGPIFPGFGAGLIAVGNSGVAVSSPLFDAVALGAVGDGTTENITVVQSIFAAASLSGGRIHFACGTYKISGFVPADVTAGQHLTLDGDGHCTILAFHGTAVGTGIGFAYGSWSTSVDVANLDMTTDDATGANTALTFAYTGSSPNPYVAAQNSITNVTLYGADGMSKTDWWGIGVLTSGVSNFNADRYSFYGASTNTGYGWYSRGYVPTGVISYIMNINHSWFQNCNVGVNYGTDLQGVVITASNFGCNYGVYVPASEANLSQLTVADSQINCINDDIYIGTTTFAVAVNHNLFYTSTNGFGINIALNNLATITGNTFVDSNGPSNDVAINLQTGAIGSTVTGNTFYNLDFGLSIGTGTTGTFIGNVCDSSVTNCYSLNASAGFFARDNYPETEYLIANLPTCSATVSGEMLTIANGVTSPTYLATVSSTGSAVQHVQCNGTNWIYH